MPATNPETLAFFAPGLLHQFGNLWLSIDGNARLLDDDVERARAAILNASGEGRHCLDVMRFLAGEPATEPDALSRVVDRILAVARVPLREAHHTTDSRSLQSSEGPLVDPAEVTVMTAEAVRHLVHSLPTGVSGRVLIEWASNDAETATVDVRFEPKAGTLPFPLGDGSLRPVGELAARRAKSVECSRSAMGLRLRFRTQRGTGASMQFGGR